MLLSRKLMKYAVLAFYLVLNLATFSRPKAALDTAIFQNNRIKIAFFTLLAPCTWTIFFFRHEATFPSAERRPFYHIHTHLAEMRASTVRFYRQK